MNKTLIVQIFVIVTIVASYLFIDFNEVYNSLRGDTKFVTQNQNCDLHKSQCDITLEDGTKMSLEVFPKNIPLMENVKFQLKSSNTQLENLTLRVYATNMFMGYFDLKFKNLGNGVYETNGVLPTCNIGNMKWNAEVELDKIDKKIGARFQFQTTR